MKTVEAMAYENAEQELRASKGVYYPNEEDAMKDYLAVSFATGYEKAFEWIKYEDEVPPEGVMLVFKLAKNIEVPQYHAGRAEKDGVVLGEGYHMKRSACLVFGLEWRLLEINQ